LREKRTGKIRHFGMRIGECGMKIPDREKDFRDEEIERIRIKGVSR